MQRHIVNSEQIFKNKQQKNTLVPKRGVGTYLNMGTLLLNYHNTGLTVLCPKQHTLHSIFHITFGIMIYLLE